MWVITTAIAKEQLPSDSASSWQQTTKQLEAAGRTDDCAQMWTLLWPWVQRNHRQATMTLAELVTWRHVVPPGYAKDPLLRVRLAMVLYREAARAGERDAMRKLAAFYDDLSALTPAHAEMAECWQQTADAKELESNIEACVAIENQSPSLPTFSAWLNEIERISRPGDEARCLSSDGNPALPTSGQDDIG